MAEQYTTSPSGNPKIPVARVDSDGQEHLQTARAPDYAGDLFRSRVSWGAIFVGTLVGLGLMSLLTLLGMSIGLSAISFGGPDGAFSGIPTGAAIWLVVSQLVSLGAGGFVAARLAAVPKVSTSALHGTAVWALASLLLIYAATTAVGSLVGGATSVVSSVASGAGSLIGQAAPAAAPDAETRRQIGEEVTTIVNNVLSQREQARASSAVQAAAADIARDPAAVQAEINQLVDQLFGQDGVIGPDDRKQAAAVLARRTGMSPAEADATIDRWQTQIVSTAQAAGNQAQSVGNSATSALSSAAFWAFVASLLGLIAAAGCAVLGRPNGHAVVTNQRSKF